MPGEQQEGFRPFCGAYGRITDEAASGIVRPSKAPGPSSAAKFHADDFVGDDVDPAEINRMFEAMAEGGHGRDPMSAGSASAAPPELPVGPVDLSQDELAEMEFPFLLLAPPPSP